MKYKLKLLKKYPELSGEIESEFSTMETALTNKVDSEMEQAISEEITIQNF